MMSIKAMAVTLAAVMVIFSPAFSGTADSSVVVDRVVAVVNGEVITLSDLQREEALKKSAGKLDQGHLLEDMIDRKLQMEAARRAGMDVSDTEVNEAIAEIKKRNSLDDRKFAAALEKDGISVDQYKNELREQMTLSRIFNKAVRSGIAVDEAEVRGYYDRNAANYSQAEEIRVRDLFIELPENATAAKSAAAREKAEAALSRARKGEDFTRLVKELSEAENAAAGGDLGFLQRDQAIAELQEAVKDLKPGDIAGPVRFGGGLHVIRLEEVRRKVEPFNKVKDDITRMLYEQKLESSYRTWLQTLRGNADIDNRL